jgi:hypothetical protein
LVNAGAAAWPNVAATFWEIWGMELPDDGLLGAIIFSGVILVGIILAAILPAPPPASVSWISRTGSGVLPFNAELITFSTPPPIAPAVAAFLVRSPAAVPANLK